MATEVPSTGTNAPEAPVPAAESPEAADEARIQKYAKQAVLASVESAEKDTAALESARGDDGGEKPRDPETGKFLPQKKEKPNGDKKAKAAPKASPEAVQKPAASGDRADGKRGDDSAEATAPVAEPLSGGLGKAKRLAREGKIAEALKLIDLDPEKIPGGQWAAWRKENRKKESEILAAHAEVESQREAVKSEARALVAELRPYAEAAEALKSGDEDRVFELIFGKTVDEWQRGRLARMHRGDLSKDPVVAEFNKKLAAERAEREKLVKLLEERDANERQRAEEAAVEKRRSEYREELAAQLEGAADERLQRAASLPWFVKMVHDEQLKSYSFNPRTKQEDYLTVDEAIERVFDEERLTAAQWKQLTGELASPEKRVPGAQNQVASDRRGNDVKRVAKAPLTLSRSEAADPTHRPDMDDEQRLTYYANLHARNLANG